MILNKLKIDKRTLKQIDFLIFLIPIVIAIFSSLNIYSAVHRNSALASTWKLQLIWCLMGIIAIYIIIKMDYDFLKNYAEIIYGLAVVLLVINDIFGSTRNGATGWIAIGQRAIQPSEFAKIALVIILAKKVDAMKDGINNVKNFFIILIYAAIPTALVLIQPDMGMAMVYFFTVLGIVFAAGLDLRVIFGGIFGIIVAVVGIWNTSLMQQYWKARLTSFLNPEKYSSSTGLQLIQSKIAIGSGGIFGKGFLKGTQIQGGYIPENYTDFIFSVVGEEWGLIGAIVLMLLYIILIYRIIKMSKNSKDAFGKIFCVGMASTFLFSVYQNMGMTIGIAPISGLTLPFMSYGGSSMFTAFIAIGIILSIGVRKNKINF
ncbi:rod shape determining protein RodA [Clostridium acetobutylicum]|uniref:Peptidoglycan glycosyltransferase RodA n=1 Tax=Clostridium acetobutylicum (strain ATCC 824 / DSM 792 / JCM 1419 / IAM 19013 / LMG 5710 / NBRC 13948 / NRRL B-527 / VKM B-1787 / 2291 / W) TaxID=272562 RepID=Q97JM3_CLOAB|nr:MULTISPECIES: rod shape-determining protein RodA [Clostridium]AAK79222.1 Cell division protein, rodA/ftsW/spoVE family [Clostridium acetobutylicum ATCC 824]ADZ20302.1 Cell division protein, rodA/ftsW/spoVE family [Clostridium acetobutylicum EA 2018]AEI33601.1 cell cycle protein FtsW [Clostridium acetobutylicum DSM 1731]AWV81528.1 rod shape-determining protein RodA [Clostridium acetobutylicum]MBC2393167.1 rod shape-determining protein RodA [Clostridium acetobutylicum]